MNFLVFDHQLKLVELTDNWYKQRSFLYGDGHFTTAKVKKGKIELLSLHMARLKKANDTLAFNALDFTKLESACVSLVSGLSFGVLKIQISRGVASRGYGQLSDTRPYVFISVSELPESYQSVQPISLALVSVKLGWNSQLAGVKHCNRLEQVLIANELEQLGWEDGLVCDIKGNVIESNKANVFWLEQGNWYTPDLTLAGVDGVMRQHIMSQTKVLVRQQGLKHILNNMDAMFISNSLIGIQAVKQVAENRLDTQAVEQLKQELQL